MSILEKLRQARLKRQAVRQLRELQPHLLRDIGIEPGQINEAVAGMLARKPEAKAQSQAPRKAPTPAPDAALYKATVFSCGAWPYPRRHAA